jgi:hypothetical protein
VSVKAPLKISSEIAFQFLDLGKTARLLDQNMWPSSVVSHSFLFLLVSLTSVPPWPPPPSASGRAPWSSLGPSTRYSSHNGGNRVPSASGPIRWQHFMLRPFTAAYHNVAVRCRRRLALSPSVVGRGGVRLAFGLGLLHGRWLLKHV